MEPGSVSRDGDARPAAHMPPEPSVDVLVTWGGHKGAASGWEEKAPGLAVSAGHWDKALAFLDCAANSC